MGRAGNCGSVSDENIDFAELGEYSVLVLGRWGRLEVGERQGLPDVLTGFAPNSLCCLDHGSNTRPRRLHQGDCFGAQKPL